MPRRKTHYRACMDAEVEFSFAEGRPLALPDGVPATLEIGMGSGRLLVARAASEPERLFVGVELKEARAWQALRAARALGLTNVRIGALAVVKADLLLPAGRFDELAILFPDPWPRERDVKRRLITPQLLRRYERLLRPGAACTFRTDSAQLFAYAKATLVAEGWTILSAEQDVPPGAISTRYEAIWRAKRLAIHQILFERPAQFPERAPFSPAEALVRTAR